MKSFCCSIFVLFSFISCTSLVEDQFPDTKRIPVLNGCLEQAELLKVHLSFSAKLSDSVPPPVLNAQVIVESTGNSPDTLIYTKDGWYVGSKIVQAGFTYRCSVNIEGYPLLTAQTTVPEPSEIDSVVFTDLVGRSEEGEKISAIEFNINNSISKKQFWHVRLISTGLKTWYDKESDQFVHKYAEENEAIYMLAGQDSILLNEANPLSLFSNKVMKSSSYKVKFYINEGYTRFDSDESYFIELRSVDEEYYKYLKQYYIYESATYTEIGKTPQKYPLYSNVTNGLGVFYSFSASRKELETTNN